MERNFSISINLLPKLDAKVLNIQIKFKKVKLFGTIVIVLLIFAVSLSFGLSIIQGQRLKQANLSLESARSHVEQFKDKEAMLLILKDRLKEIDRVNSQPSKQAALYGLFNRLIPASFSVNTIIIDTDTNSNLVATTPDVASVDSFLDDLVDKKKNEDIVSNIIVDNFSRIPEGGYRVAFKIEGR